MRAERVGWTVCLGSVLLCSRGVSQTSEETQIAELATGWANFKSSVVAARQEVHERLVAIAAERDAQTLDAAGFKERLTAFNKESPLWADSWAQLLPEPDAQKRAVKIDAMLDARTRLLTTPDPTSCFDKKGKYASSPGCEKLLKGWCYALAAPYGTPTIRRADQNLAIRQEPVRSVEELREAESGGSDPAPYGYDELRFSFCSAAAAARKYDFGYIKYASYEDPPLWSAYASGIDPFSASSELFEQSCHDRDRLAKMAQMLSYELASVPRDQVWSMHLASWSDRVGRRLKQCTAAVRDDCGNVYFLRGVPIVSYRTVSCRVRDVAEADVLADIKDMDEFDTEAKRLGHLQLVDHLHACASARANGYFWVYAKPTLNGCNLRRP